MSKKRKKGRGWKHPKTGEIWSSKKGYHKYWEKYLKPKSKKQRKKEEEELELELENSFVYSEEYWRNYGYYSDQGYE